MDVPPATGTAPTITLGEVKSRIAASLQRSSTLATAPKSTWNACGLHISTSVKTATIGQTYPDRSGSKVGNVPPYEHEFDSGLAMGSMLYGDDLGFGPTADNLNQLWLDGGDVDLFNVEFGEPVPYDSTGDGVNDIVNFTPAGVIRAPAS